MENVYSLSRSDLEKRVLNEEGKVKPEASFKEFFFYVGEKSRNNKEGFQARTYHCLYEAAKYIKKISDLDKFREMGIKGSPFAGIIGFGEKSAEDFNRVLSNYGIKKIPWITEEYKDWKSKEHYRMKVEAWTLEKFFSH